MRHKSILAAALSLLLLLGALTGCGQTKEVPPTAESLLRDMNEKMAEQGSASARLQMSFSFETESQGAALRFPVDMELTMDMILSPLQLHARGTAGMSLLGMDMDIPLEFYVQEEDEDMAVYVNVMDSWMKQTAEKGDEIPSLGSGIPEELIAAAVLREETEEVLDRTAYRIDFPITGEMLESVLAPMREELEDGTTGFSLADMAADASIWIEQETGLPVRQSVTLTSPIRGGEFTIREMEILIDYTAFDDVDGITIPPEALNAQIDNLLDNIM